MKRIFCFFYCLALSVVVAESSLKTPGEQRVPSQDVEIVSISSSPIQTDVFGPSKWRHAFFKQRNLICGFNGSNAHVFSQEIFTKNPSQRLLGFKIDPTEEIIVDAVVFHRDDGFARLGLVTRKIGYSTGFLREFKIGDKVQELFKLSLQGNPTAFKFVCGLQGCAYAILYEHKGQFGVEQTTPRDDVNVFEFRVPAAIFLESVKLRGLRHLLAASRTHVYVFRSNHFLTSFKLISTFAFKNLRSIKGFRTGPSTYITLASDNRQSLMELRPDGGLKPVHELQIPHTASFLPLYPASLDTHILAMTQVTPGKPVMLLLFSRQSETLLEIRNPPAVFSVSENSMTSFSSNQEHVSLLFFDPFANHPVLVDIKYKLVQQRGPLYDLIKQASSRIEAMKARLEHQEIVLETAKQIMKQGALKQAVLHRIPRNAKFDDIDVRGTVHMELEPSVQVGVVDSSIVVQPDKSVVEDLKAKLTSLKPHLQAAREALKVAVFKNRIQRPISVPKKIVGSLNSPSIDAVRTTLDFLGGERAKKVIDSLYFFNEGPRLVHRLIFLSGISAPSVNCGTLNGLDVTREAVVAGRDNRLFGEYSFTKGLLLKTNSLVHGPLGPLSDTSKIMRVSNVTSPDLKRKLFENVIVKERVETTYMNSVKLSDLPNLILNSLSSQIVKTPIIIHGNVTTTFLSTKTANGMELNAPLTRFVYPDVPAVIRGRKNFKNVDFKRGLNVRHTLNGLRIPEDLLLRHAEQKVTAPKTFAAGLAASSIIQGGLLNGISFPKDVASLTKPSVVSGVVEFPRGASFNSIRSGGPIDNLKIDEFIKQKNTNRRSGPIVFHGSVTADQVDVKGPIDGLSIRKLWEDIIPVQRDPKTPLEITGQKVFLSELSANKVHAPLINNLNLQEDLARIGKPIGGSKILLNSNVHVDHMTSTGSMINGINVKVALSNRITLRSPQTIAIPVVLQEIRTGNVAVEGLLNGDNFPGDFVTRNSPESIQGEFSCDQLIIRSKKLLPHEKIHTPFIAGISNALKHRTALNDNVDFDFVNLQNVKSKIVDAHNVDGVNFEAFAKRVLRDNGNKITFSGRNVFENLVLAAPFSTNLVNGFNIVQLDKLAVSLNKPATITVPIVFRDKIIVRGPLRSSFINGKPGQVLNNIANKRDTHISAPVRFQQKVRSEGPVDAHLVNNAVLGRDFLTISTPQTISSHIAFGGRVHVSGKHEGVPIINGVDLQSLNMNLARVSPTGKIFVDSPLIFEAPLKLNGNVYAQRVNGEDLKTLVSHSNCMTEKVVGSLEVQGPLQLTQGALVHNYNGFKNLPKRMAQIVFNDDKIYRLKNTYFENLKVEGNAQCEQVFFNGLLNDLPFEKILEEAIPIHSKKSIRVPGVLTLQEPTSANFLHVDDRINGLRFPEGLLRKCKNCKVQKLENVTVFSMDVAHIEAMGTNHVSYPLWDLMKTNRVLDEDKLVKQILQGQRVVEKLIVEGDLESKTINGGEFTRRLARTDGLSELQSPIFETASFQNLTLHPRETDKCLTNSVACQIRSFQRRNCFDWHLRLPRFENVIFEKGVQTERINGVDLRPARQRRQSALNNLSLRIQDSQNALEQVRHVNEQLVDC